MCCGLEVTDARNLFNPWCHAKVLPKRFHLNGHTIGFRSQIHKLETTSNVFVNDSGSKNVKS